MAKTNTTTSNIMTMKDALTWAHDEMHNSHAISEKEFIERLGGTKQDFDNWCAYVEELRDATKAYIVLAEDKSATAKKINDALGGVWQAWRGVVKDGTEKDFNKNFFVRQNDANTIAEWCGRSATLTARGRVWSAKGATDFRKHVETLIGIRMAGNAVLTDDERDLITAYEGALKAIKRNEDMLADKVERGKTTYGLRSKLKFAQKRFDEMDAKLTAHGVDDVTKQDLLSEYRLSVSNAATAVADAEKNVANAEKVRDEKKDAYDKAIALIKSVGGEV